MQCSHVFLSNTLEFLHIRVTQEIRCSLCEDGFYLRIENGVRHIAGKNHENAWPQHIIVVA